ncbi:hypothetical protein BDDG_02732 [Blastomyces dermatitidis ATCC 18188]|uniref:Uncharacterized protein n=1 Tax=Ajellomyces dermatitidis (strain ATCC 18188 / CBS 674.68) TaxID=653446 RepID=F2T978_AJEDA|nr:hypothetical protein BDDG_02732 [Blastomyces dermatitidis ATCC 18188]EQL33293.1 hypothetical protein BDFG_04724 [Blastomyces dermatitidis ATCC 26199]
MKAEEAVTEYATGNIVHDRHYHPFQLDKVVTRHDDSLMVRLFCVDGFRSSDSAWRDFDKW